jgi:hypothetical protein
MASALPGIYRTEGAKVFFRGGLARVMWLVPSTALSLSICTGVWSLTDNYKTKSSRLRLILLECGILLWDFLAQTHARREVTE